MREKKKLYNGIPGFPQLSGFVINHSSFPRYVPYLFNTVCLFQRHPRSTSTDEWLFSEYAMLSIH